MEGPTGKSPLVEIQAWTRKGLASLEQVYVRGEAMDQVVHVRANPDVSTNRRPPTNHRRHAHAPRS